MARELTAQGLRERAGSAPGVRLIAVDVDGTILTSEHRVAPRTVAAVRRALAHGVEVVLATSRGPSALRVVLEQLEPLAEVPFIASQGALTGSFSDQGSLHVVERHPIELRDARQLVRAATALGLPVHWFSADGWFVSAVDATVEEESRTVGVNPAVVDLLALEQRPDKLMLISPSDDLGPVRALTEGLPATLISHSSNPWYLDLTRREVDKATALGSYCRARGIDSSSVAAIGDGPNDLPMLAYAGLSIAPANARAEVLARVHFTTASNDDDGVAHAIDILLGG